MAENKSPVPPISVQVDAQAHATGTDTVTVACNIPMGLILQIFDTEKTVSYLQNGRPIEENVSRLNLDHGQWAVHGPVNFNALAAAGRDVNVDFRVVRGDIPDTGYALTPGIPRDFWERWYAQNERGPLVTGRHVFSASSENRAAAKAREYREIRSGFQGLNPAGDYRVPGGRAIRKFDRQDNATTPVENPEDTQ